MFREGLAVELRAPLELLLGAAPGPGERRLTRRIESIRSEFLRSSTSCAVLSGPPNGQTAHSHQRPLRWLARTASIPAYWGAFLHLCANTIRAKTILELGACVGISGCYLSSGSSCERFYTIEGSQELAGLAESAIGQISKNATVCRSDFDAGLDRILPELRSGVDLAYIDGHHEKLATLKYVDRLKPHMNRGSLLILDDIHWADEMEEAWKVICGQKGFRCSIDLGRFGLCVCDDEAASSRCFNLSPYTRLWQSGKPKYPGPRAGQPASGTL